MTRKEKRILIGVIGTILTMIFMGLFIYSLIKLDNIVAGTTFFGIGIVISASYILIDLKLQD